MRKRFHIAFRPQQGPRAQRYPWSCVIWRGDVPLAYARGYSRGHAWRRAHALAQSRMRAEAQSESA